jgi:hypothetical protein
MNELQMEGAPVRSRGWRLRHSWWLGLILFSLGLRAWVAFGYIGIRTRQRRWVGSAGLYLLLAGASLALLAAGGASNSTLEPVLGLLLWLGLFVGSVAHSLVTGAHWRATGAHLVVLQLLAGKGIAPDSRLNRRSLPLNTLRVSWVSPYP